MRERARGGQWREAKTGWWDCSSLFFFLNNLFSLLSKPWEKGHGNVAVEEEKKVIICHELVHVCVLVRT